MMCVCQLVGVCGNGKIMAHLFEVFELEREREGGRGGRGRGRLDEGGREGGRGGRGRLDEGERGCKDG